MSEFFHPILQTSRSEIADTCRDSDHNGAIASDDEALALAVESAPEDQIAAIARKLGDYMMDGSSYWSGLPLAAEEILGIQLPPPEPELEPIESDAPLGPRSRESGLAQRAPGPDSPDLSA
jgi:hypothetical protein